MLPFAQAWRRRASMMWWRSAPFRVVHDELVLFTGLYPHLASARDNAVVRDIRVGGTKSVELLVELLEERGLACRPLGLIEPDSYRLPGIPHRDMTHLQEACSQAELVPCTRVLEAAVKAARR
jgi:hypothetical protein